MFGTGKDRVKLLGYDRYSFTESPLLSVDELNVTNMLEKPKRRAASDSHVDACQVCGDQVAGKYFGAHVCMPCKIFFLRNHDKGDVLTCSGIASNGACVVNKNTRTNCSSCRYRKCIHVGMAKKERPEVVEPLNGQKLCMVCSDIANGIHFGVVSCEGCKKFFRRSMGEQDKYKCRGQQQCAINPRSRNTCRYCRYQKCLTMGMSPEVCKKDQVADADWKNKLPRASCSSTSSTSSLSDLTPSHESPPLPGLSDSPVLPTFPKLPQSSGVGLPPFTAATYNQKRNLSPPAGIVTQSRMQIHPSMQHMQNKGYFNEMLQDMLPCPQVRSEHASTAPTGFYPGNDLSPLASYQRDTRTPSSPMDLSDPYSNCYNNTYLPPQSPTPVSTCDIAYSRDSHTYQMSQSKLSSSCDILYESDSPMSSQSVSPTAQDMHNCGISSSMGPDHANRRIKRIFSSLENDIPDLGVVEDYSPATKLLKSVQFMNTSREASPDKQFDPTLIDIAKKLEIKDNDAKQIYAPIMKECLSLFKPHEFTNTVVSKTVHWMHEHDPSSDPSWVLKLMDVESLRNFEVGYTILDDILKYFTVDNPSGPLVDINSFFDDLYSYTQHDVEYGSTSNASALVQNKLLRKISNNAKKPLTNQSNVYLSTLRQINKDGPKKSNPNTCSKLMQDPMMKKLLDTVDKYSSLSSPQAKLGLLSQANQAFYRSDYWLHPQLSDEVLTLTDEYKMIIRSVARSLQQYTFSFIWDRLLLYQQYNTSSKKSKSMDYTATDVQKFLMDYLDKQASAMAGFVADLPAWKSMDKRDQLHIIYKMMPLRIMCMALYMYDPEGKLMHPVAWNWYNWPWMEFIHAFSSLCEELLAMEVDLIEASLTLVLAGISSDSSSLQRPDLVEEVRKPFQGALIAYLQKKYGLTKWKSVMKKLLSFVPKMRILYAWFGAVWQNIIFSIST